MKKFIGLLIFIGLLVFLYFSCPDKTAHDEALSESLTEVINDKLSSSGIATEDVKKIIKEVGSYMVDVDSYLIFSLGKFNDEVVSFGIGGYVFTFNDEIVKKGAEFAQSAKEKIKDLFF